MSVKNYLSILGTLLGSFIFVISCSKETEIENSLISNSREIQSELVKIPYASKSELEKFLSNKNFVDYNLSREVAFFDLEDFKKEIYNNKSNLTLSEFPVIIYDNNNNPKYYEFIVLDNAKEVGTITSFAQKEVPGFTAYVLPFVRDYSVKNATRYSEIYPHTSVEEKLDLNISARKVISEEELKIRSEAKIFWEEIEKESSQSNISAFVRAWNEEYIIPEFNNDALLRTRWIGDCGPAALAWLYRAYYPTYKGILYPLHGQLRRCS